MSPHPTAAITIAGGEITVDAELLAPKLGLSAAALKAEMRKTAVIAYRNFSLSLSLSLSHS